MKKITIAVVVLVMICFIFVEAGSANIEKLDRLSTNFSNIPSENIETKEIKVALFSQVFLMGSGHSKFFDALNGYSWLVGNTKYSIVVDKIYDKDIYRGDLTTDNYDVLVMPGGGGGGHSISTKWMINRPLVKIWRKKMIDFIKDGGGYFGVCGGSWFLLGWDKPPRSLSEIRTEKSSLGVSCVKLMRPDEPYENIISSQFTGRWDTIGVNAYMYYSGWDFGPTQRYPGGLWFNVSVNKNHTIFDDYLTDTVRVSWSGGPAYVVPENPDREITVLSNYPNYEFSDNEKTRIYYWKYTGGIKGFINGGLENIIKAKSSKKFYLPDYFYKASDWEKSDKIVVTNYSNKPFMTAEVYSNKNQARIFLCSGHPECKVLFGGQVIELEDTNDNNLYDGLIGWTNFTPIDETIEDERSYTWWVIRRGIAWAAKIPDNDLPPIYGPSQASDISPYNRSSNFYIVGNAEISTGTVSLDLYYRHSTDNKTWSDWALYGTDKDSSDGWSWNFQPPVGQGHYEFYSKRCVRYKYEWLNETAPPGPDAFAYIDL